MYVSNQGAKDPRCPIAGVQIAFDSARLQYAAHGCAEKIKLYADESAAHSVTPSMWNEAEAWFVKYL